MHYVYRPEQLKLKLSECSSALLPIMRGNGSTSTITGSVYIVVLYSESVTTYSTSADILGRYRGFMTILRVVEKGNMSHDLKDDIYVSSSKPLHDKYITLTVVIIIHFHESCLLSLRHLRSYILLFLLLATWLLPLLVLKQEMNYFCFFGKTRRPVA
jgi:hypothetical protein